GVALEVDEITEEVVFGAAEEIVEAYVVQSGRGREGGDVTTQVMAELTSAHHHGEGVPTHDATDGALHVEITRHLGFGSDGDGVAVRGGERVDGEELTGFSGFVGQTLQQKLGTIHALFPD